MNSKLSLSTKLSSSSKTQLAEYFATPSFKVITLPSYDDAWANGLNAMQMSSSPGLLAGDLLEIDISLAKSTAPHDGASVLACAYQLKVRSQNPKNFEHWFSQRLWVKFAMFY